MPATRAARQARARVLKLIEAGKQEAEDDAVEGGVAQKGLKQRFPEQRHDGKRVPISLLYRKTTDFTTIKHHKQSTARRAWSPAPEQTAISEL